MGIATLLILAAAAASTPSQADRRADPVRGPIRFDLSDLAGRPAPRHAADDARRWTLRDLEEPGEARGKPMFRWRLTKVKFRVPLPSI